METVFNFMNGSNMLNRITVETFDNAGDPANLLLRKESPFEEEAAVDSLGLEVSGLGTTVAVSANEDPNQVDVGYALIYSDWGEDFGVEVVFQQVNSQGRLTATTAIIPLPPTDGFSFVVFSNSAAKTGIAILNPPDAEEDAEVTLSLFDNVGTWQGDAVRLTTTEFNLLAFLLKNQGRVLSRDRLLEQVWGYRYGGTTRTVDTHIQRLREKLGSEASCIETVRGIGYKAESASARVSSYPRN